MSDVLAELRRELAVRQKCFPRWVADGKLKQLLADHRILMISQAIALIESVQPQQQQLFQVPSIRSRIWMCRISRCHPGEEREYVYDWKEYEHAKVYADSAQLAAEQFAQSWDQGEYDVCNGELIIEVSVLTIESWELGHLSAEQAFIVNGSMLPNYHATLSGIKS